MTSKRRVLRVGATGMLGSAIVDAVLGRKCSNPEQRMNCQ
jgi:hypothetical protein